MEINLTLTREEAQHILNLLVKQPYVEVVDVIDKIQAQAHEQMQQEG